VHEPLRTAIQETSRLASCLVSPPAAAATCAPARRKVVHADRGEEMRDFCRWYGCGSSPTEADHVSLLERGSPTSAAEGGPCLGRGLHHRRCPHHPPAKRGGKARRIREVGKRVRLGSRRELSGQVVKVGSGPPRRRFKARRADGRLASWTTSAWRRCPSSGRSDQGARISHQRSRRSA
jgi:hypothetical protein